MKTRTSPWAYLFIAPAIAVFLIFSIIPTIYTFVISTFKWNELNPAKSKFIGLDNYARALSGDAIPNFWNTMWVSFIFVFAIVVLGTGLSLFLAFLMRESTSLMPAARASVFLAHITPLVATSMIWIWIFNPRFGLLNGVLGALGFDPVDWLGGNHSAMVSIIIFTLWHEVGFTTIIFVGGMTTLSKELHEAAILDGASRVTEFFRVTVPQLIPYIVFVMVTSSVASLHAFTQFFMLTGGGPDYRTATLGFQVYEQAFVLRHTGYAAALAVVLFLISLALTLVQLQVNKRMRT